MILKIVIETDCSFRESRISGSLPFIVILFLNEYIFIEIQYYLIEHMY